MLVELTLSNLAFSIKSLMHSLVVRLVCPLCFEKVPTCWAFDRRILRLHNICYFIAPPSACDAILIPFVTLYVRDVYSGRFLLCISGNPDTLI